MIIVRIEKNHKRIWKTRDFSGSPAVKIPCFTAGGTGSISGLGIKILHAMHGGKKRDREREENLFFKKIRIRKTS